MAGRGRALARRPGGLTGGAAADSIGTGFAEFGEDVQGSEISLNLSWIVLGAMLVVFMQAGFALVDRVLPCEARRPLVSTNFAIFGLGMAGYFLVGFGPMFGGYTATIGSDAVPVIGDGAFTEAMGSFLVDIASAGSSPGRHRRWATATTWPSWPSSCT